MTGMVGEGDEVVVAMVDVDDVTGAGMEEEDEAIGGGRQRRWCG